MPSPSNFCAARATLVIGLLLAFGAPVRAQDQAFAIRVEQAYIDLHHALSIEIQIARIAESAEDIWQRSFAFVAQVLPQCASLYDQSHQLMPPIEAAFRAGDVDTVNRLGRQASDLLAAADQCAQSTDVFASNSGEPPDAEEPQPDDSTPAVLTWADADRLAGDIVGGLKFLFGAQTIDNLSRPRSHQANIQSAVELAVEDYFAGVALSAVVARLTKGQVRNFLGQVGQKILQETFPESIPQARIPEVPGRIVDLLDQVRRIAREVKVGAPNARSSFTQNQIRNDALLVQNGYTVEWWNVRNPLTGVQVFSQELIETLMANGIRPVSHINP